MLKPNTKLAIYMQDALGEPHGKMGHGILRYSKNPIVAVIDSKHAEECLSSYVACEHRCPIVDSIEKARALGGEALVLGIAPPGGAIPDSWYEPVERALALGFCLINGLHTRLADRYTHIRPPQWIWDIRTEPHDLTIGKAEARKLLNKRVLFIGSDMSVGKMTAALELYHSALRAKIRAEFIATGQTGIAIARKGVALDAIRLDYACGAIERAVMEVQNAELILIEGQGSLAHPGSTANLPLLRGSCPTHLIFCHRAGQKTLFSAPEIVIPALGELINLYEELAYACGTYLRPQTVGICVNTAHLTPESAHQAIRDLEQSSGLTCVDVVREGAHALLPALGYNVDTSS